MKSWSSAVARGSVLPLVLALVLTLACPAPAAAKPMARPRNASLVGDDVFFEVGAQSFLIPLATIRYPSTLRAPIFQFYFDAPIEGVTGQLVQLDSVRCHYWLARVQSRTILNGVIGQAEDDLSQPAQASEHFIASGTLHGLEAFHVDTRRGLSRPRQQGGLGGLAGFDGRAAASGPWEDWFILRDQQHQVRTLIRCRSARAQQEHGDTSIAFCTHLANLDPEQGEKFQLRYPRAYLGAWHDIQRQVETLLLQFKQRGAEAVGAGAGSGVGVDVGAGTGTGRVVR